MVEPEKSDPGDLIRETARSYIYIYRYFQRLRTYGPGSKDLYYHPRLPILQLDLSQRSYLSISEEPK